MAGRDGPAPLPTLLSQAYVAFAIEADNAFEERMPHQTARGDAARRRHPQRVAAVQAGWRTRYGAREVDALVAALAPIVGDGTPEGSPLFGGLAAREGTWRFKRRVPETLPHFPMVLHRGGYPDGS